MLEFYYGAHPGVIRSPQVDMSESVGAHVNAIPVSDGNGSARWKSDTTTPLRENEADLQ